MRYHLDLTGCPHLEMEYTLVSTAAFDVPVQLGNELSLLIYGFRSHAIEDFPQLCDCLPESIKKRLPAELYYKGWAKLTFQGVESGSIEIAPFQPLLPPANPTFMFDQGGKIVRLRREWSAKAESHAVEYWLQCDVERPYGAMYLVLKAAGPVILSVDPKEFVLNPGEENHLEVDYDATRSRQLRSID